MKKIIVILILFAIFISLNAKSHSLLDTGVNQYKKGQYDFAVNNLRKFILIAEQNSVKSKAYYYLALSYYFLDKPEQALSNFDELESRYKLSEYTAQSFFWKGLVFHNQKEWLDAKNAFLKYVTVLPNSDLIPRAITAAANSMLELSDYNGIKLLLEDRILRLDNLGDYEQAFLIYIFVLLKLGLTNDADQLLITWLDKIKG